MKHFIIYFLLICFIKCNLFALPPRATINPDTLIIHGDTNIDNYYWLRYKDDPEVMALLEAENEYLDIMLQPAAEFKENLYQKMIGRINETDMSVPYFLNDYWYYTRTEAGKEHAIYCRKKADLNSDEEIILDVNEFKEKYDYYNFFLWRYSISPDNNKALIFGNKSGGDEINLFIKDLLTAEVFEEVLKNVYVCLWTNDNNSIIYEKAHPLSGHTYQVYLHKLNDINTEDVLIYEEKDLTFSVLIYTSRSGEYVFIGSLSEEETEFWYVPANDPESELQLITPRESGHMYFPDIHNGKLYIYTNYEAANFSVMFTGITTPTIDNWQELIAHDPDIMISDLTIFRNFIVAEEIHNGFYKLRIVNLENFEQHYIEFNDEVYLISLGANYESNTDSLRFKYESLSTPPSIYSYNMETGEKTLLKRYEIYDHDPDNYISERIWARSDDGILIPVSLLYKKGLKKDGNNPVYIEAYGAYGEPFPPNFNDMNLPYVERGFIYAIAHVRGGSDMGWDWYEAGRRFNKMNTITDLIACVEHLISEGYTKQGLIVVKGISAGGIPAGGVINERPELFKAAILSVPFVDMINTMLDPDLPLTTLEYEEWGNPENPEAYHYIKSYSPYDNVKAQNYPHILLITGFNDALVGYWEPAKMTAKLRSLKTDDNLLLLRTIFDGGHGGPAGRYNKYKEAALEQAFVFYVFGILD